MKKAYKDTKADSVENLTRFQVFLDKIPSRILFKLDLCSKIVNK